MVGKKLKKRHQRILNALRDLGGTATTRQIAIATSLHVNGVSQSMNVLGGQHIQYLGGTGTDRLWKLKNA
ncbi:MAG: hypothetical protein AAB343_02590 [Patescibacteria group bacterium]